MVNSELLGISFLQLNVLFIVAKQQNISKASEELHMTQSTVTKIIQRVEENLHTKLFDRTNKGVFLTEQGQFLLQKWEKSFKEMDSDLSLLYQQQTETNTKLSIALCNTINGHSCFWPYIDKFQQQYPNITLDIQGDSVWDLRKKVINNSFDLVFMPEFEKYSCKDDDLNWCYVKKGPVIIYYHKDHVFQNKTPSSLFDLKDETFMVASTDLLAGYSYFFDNLCCQHGFYAKKIIKQKNPYMIEPVLRKDGAILLGDEYFIVTENMPDIHSLVLPDLTFGIIALWKNSNQNPNISKFVSLLDKKQ